MEWGSFLLFRRYAKLRQQIEDFARKSPQTFVQLMERLMQNENTYKQRQVRQQQMERRREEKEAEAARRLRYPIADELLPFEPELDPPLPAPPIPRYRVNLPPEAQHLVGEMLSACDMIATFGDMLGISAISVEELRSALLQRYAQL